MKAEIVEMLPDDSQPWMVRELPEAGVRILFAPECPVSVARKTVALAAGDYRDIRLPLIGGGGEASVYEFEDKALRVVTTPTSGIYDVVANLALAEGLEKIQDEVKADTGIIYSAPAIHAVALPAVGREYAPVMVMAMDKAQGRRMWRGADDPAGREQRHAVYDAALRTVGIEPADVNLDDDWKNLLVRREGVRRRITEIVKLDIHAAEGSELALLPLPHL